MESNIGADAAKLAGLQIDLLQKIREGRISLGHLEWFNNLNRERRDRFCSGKKGVSRSRFFVIDRIPLNMGKLKIPKEYSIVEQDERSLIQARVKLADIKLENMLRIGEYSIDGEERIKRLKKAGYIRLDAKILQILLEHKNLIPEDWERKKIISFDGTIFQEPDGHYSVLCLDYTTYWSSVFCRLSTDLPGVCSAVFAAP